MEAHVRDDGIQPARRLLRVPEACHALSISRTTLYAMLARAELPVVRIGNAHSGVRIPSDAVDAWIDRQISRASS